MPELDEVSDVEDFGPDPGQAAVHAIASLITGVIRDLGIAPIPDPEPPSPRQRLRIHIPEVETTMSMGAAAPAGTPHLEHSGGLPNYEGFGVHTKGFVWVDAEKSMTLQAEEAATLQSMGNVGIGSGSTVFVGGKSGVIVSGGGGVTLLGGWPKNVAPQIRSDGEEPPEPGWIAPIEHSKAAIQTLSAGVDAGLGLYSVASGVLKKKHGKRVFRLRSLAAVAKLGGTLGGISSSVGTLGGVNDLTGWHNKTLATLDSLAGAMLLYGNAGGIGSTPMTMGLYSLMGTTIYTTGDLALHGLGCDITSTTDMAIESTRGCLELSGEKELEITSNGEVKIASKTGEVVVAGAGIHIGGGAGSGGQAGTKDLSLDATEVHLSAGEYALLQSFGRTTVSGTESVRLMSLEGPAYVLGKAGVAVSANEGKVSMGSPKGVVLRSGSMHVLVDDKTVALGKQSGALPEKPARPAHEKLPPIPNGKKALKDWNRQADDIIKKNAEKDKEHSDKLKTYRKDLETLKEVSVGVVIKDDRVDVVVDGHRVRIDSSSISNDSIKIQK